MLVLTRKEGQRIIVGDNELTIQVLGIEERWVRLGIEAPRELSVHREEVYNSIKLGEEMNTKPKQ